ncbi:hypothetical protein HOE22_09315 [Candidatus Woesearchaeota archaeon]|jgi:ribosomal protein L11|nr:hypothetical protein [Candidatus Woesearchaeota archaeon]MBT4732605.1 hypothetical protein [Candidatus Woesearchaeota archaeon]MBT7557456.1 hypothetical protein [Candidatus Woesearchaeota archaeon]
MKKSNGTHYINCYNQKTEKREMYEVPYDVSVYVKQLEMKIKYPDNSKLTRLFPELKERDYDGY